MNSQPNCDLHIHSSYSDGALTPAQIVRAAAGAGLCALSITDHDTAEGQAEALEAGDRHGIEVISGIEFSVREDDLDIHILSYCFDPGAERLNSVLEDLERGREKRASKIADLLQDIGISVTYEEIREDAGSGTIGRPHIARVLLSKGIVTGFQEAFDRFIGYGAPCYVPKKVLSLEEVVSLIKETGGVAVWAHPGANIRKKGLVERILGSGVDGIEAWHPNHSKEIVRLVKAEAGRRGLVMTGGSDYHFDEAMKVEIGGIEVPCDSVTALKRLSSGLSA